LADYQIDFPSINASKILAHASSSLKLKFPACALKLKQNAPRTQQLHRNKNDYRHLTPDP
jgi:hypothetical protein